VTPIPIVPGKRLRDGFDALFIERCFGHDLPFLIMNWIDLPLPVHSWEETLPVR